MNECPMCGKNSNRFVGRWYQYDNGERSRDLVCQKCADAHDKAVAK